MVSVSPNELITITRTRHQLCIWWHQLKALKRRCEAEGDKPGVDSAEESIAQLCRDLGISNTPDAPELSPETLHD